MVGRRWSGLACLAVLGTLTRINLAITGVVVQVLGPVRLRTTYIHRILPNQTFEKEKYSMFILSILSIALSMHSALHRILPNQTFEKENTDERALTANIGLPGWQGELVVRGAGFEPTRVLASSTCHVLTSK